MGPGITIRMLHALSTKTPILAELQNHPVYIAISMLVDDQLIILMKMVIVLVFVLVPGFLLLVQYMTISHLTAVNKCMSRGRQVHLESELLLMVLPLVNL